MDNLTAYANWTFFFFTIIYPIVSILLAFCQKNIYTITQINFFLFLSNYHLSVFH